MDVPEETAAVATAAQDTKMNFLLSSWILLCIFGFVCFFQRVINGRRQLRTNFNAIEEQLRRIQERIDANTEEECNNLENGELKAIEEMEGLQSSPPSSPKKNNNLEANDETVKADPDDNGLERLNQLINEIMPDSDFLSAKSDQEKKIE